MQTPPILLENVSVSYGPHKALENISGTFQAGSLTAVAGPNGAGKSSLLKLIAGLVRPRKGRITLAPEMRDKIGYLPQSSAIARDYPLSVMQTVCIGFWPELGDIAAISSSHKKRALKALEQVDLAQMKDRQIGMLSGGQFQKLLFARLYLQDPQILLLDEPFASLDGETTARLIGILLDWHKKGKTIICVLHDLLLIKKYFPDSFLLAGKCLGTGHTHVLFEKNLLSFDLDMAEIIAPKEEKKG